MERNKKQPLNLVSPRKNSLLYQQTLISPLQGDFDSAKTSPLSNTPVFFEKSHSILSYI
jgi:hypothetical protein